MCGSVSILQGVLIVWECFNHTGCIDCVGTFQSYRVYNIVLECFSPTGFSPTLCIDCVGVFQSHRVKDCVGMFQSHRVNRLC